MSDTDLGQRFACGGEEELVEIIHLYGAMLNNQVPFYGNHENNDF